MVEHDFDLLVGACRKCGAFSSDGEACKYPPGVISISYLYLRKIAYASLVDSVSAMKCDIPSEWTLTALINGDPNI